MFVKAISAQALVMALAAVSSVTPAFADLRGPAELPPASFKGQQYVDSRGCVFLRAGYAGQVTWVPRVTRDKKQLCGYGASGPVEVAEAGASAPKAAPQPAAKTVEAAPAAAPAAVVAAAPKGKAGRDAGAVVIAGQGGAGYVLTCPAATPVAERFEVLGGGSKTLCTKGDGNLAGASFPKLQSGDLAGVATGYDAHVATGGTAGAAGSKAGAGKGGSGQYTIVTEQKRSTRSATLPKEGPPAGYKTAWKDDRLNPNRGKQTVEGFLSMDEIWTRTTPAELREESTVKRRPVTIIVRHSGGETSKHDGFVVSTKDGDKILRVIDGKEFVVSKSAKAVVPVKASAKATPKTAAKAPAKAAAKADGGVKAAVAPGRLFVQVGTFAVPSNAEGLVGRLQGQGLPVARGKAKGGAWTVVYAGPFASGGEAKQALQKARAMGFGDARIVQ